MFKKILTIIKLWPEFFSIPMGLLLWVVSPWLLRSIDPVAGVFDSGVLQTFIFAIVGMLLFNGVVFGGIKANFPSLFEWYATSFKTEFKELTSWQKHLFLLLVYAVLCLALVLLAATL
jgi:hypothetical protein